MGTITTRKRKDGSTTHDAQIRTTRKGVKVYQESQTFDRKTTAQSLIRTREAELHEPEAIEKVNQKGVTARDMVSRYLDEYEKAAGRTARSSRINWRSG